MKLLKIPFNAIIIFFFIFQGMSIFSNSDIESYPYSVLKEYEGFEVRQYESANFAYVTMSPASYKENSSNGFRMLAGYIFGGNQANQKIAMTSPVAMNTADSTTMMFMVPAEYKLEEMPMPNDSRVHFKNEPGKVMAAIRFGGWADDDRIERYTAKLTEKLAEANITHTGNFSFLGYNPPYEIFNRRNEVVVEVTQVQSM